MDVCWNKWMDSTQSSIGGGLYSASGVANKWFPQPFGMVGLWVVLGMTFVWGSCILTHGCSDKIHHGKPLPHQFIESLLRWDPDQCRHSSICISCLCLWWHHIFRWFWQGFLHPNWCSSIVSIIHTDLQFWPSSTSSWVLIWTSVFWSIPSLINELWRPVSTTAVNLHVLGYLDGGWQKWT